MKNKSGYVLAGRDLAKVSVLVAAAPCEALTSRQINFWSDNVVLFKSCPGIILLLLLLQMWADSDRGLSERDSCSGRRFGSGNGKHFRAKHTEERTGAAGFFLHLHQLQWNRQDCIRRQGTHHSANHSIRKQFKVRTSYFSWTSQFCPGPPAARRALFM
jgi:hypothetical protein